MKKLTIREAAERVGVSGALVYRWCRERRLAHYRLGAGGNRGKILIDEADLDAFVESQKVDGVVTAPSSADAGASVSALITKVTDQFEALDAERLRVAWKQQGVL